jgi:hypothetical protein
MPRGGFPGNRLLISKTANRDVASQLRAPKVGGLLRRKMDLVKMIAEEVPKIITAIKSKNESFIDPLLFAFHSKASLPSRFTVLPIDMSLGNFLGSTDISHP